MQQREGNSTALRLIPEITHNNYLLKFPYWLINQFCVINILSSHTIKAKQILFIDHNLGGGANLYRESYTKKELSAGNQIILLTFNYYLNSYELCVLFKNIKQSLSCTKLKQIIYILTKYIGIERIVLSETVSFPKISALLHAILLVQNAHNAKLVILVHDFFCICPSYNLLDNNSIFCGPPDNISKCMNCLPKNNESFRYYYKNPNIILWRIQWKQVLEKSDEIICFSSSSKKILLKAYPSISQGKILITPHATEYLTNWQLQKESNGNILRDNNTLIIGILGMIQIPKGSIIVAEMVNIIEQEKRNIHIIVIGEITPSILSNHIEVTGKYTHDRLPRLVKENNIDIFLIPSIWPETFSYTTEEIIQMNMPLAVFNIGAPAEKVINYTKGIIISKIDSRTALNEICNYMGFRNI